MMDLPRRIADGGAGDWERSVILSARTDAPSEQFRRNLQKKVGVAVGAASLTTATASAKSLGALLLKWLMLGMTIGVVGAGAASYATTAVGRRASSRANATALLTVRPPPAPGRMPTRDPPPSLTSSVATPVQATSGISASAARTPPQPANAAASLQSLSAPTQDSLAGPTQLSQEMAAIKAARAALASRDATGALSELNQYERSYPVGLFKVEAQVLRIDALLELGQSAAAQDLAQRFLATQPNSPYARHVRSVASAATKTNP
jgi:hypothetical protein